MAHSNFCCFSFYRTYRRWADFVYEDIYISIYKTDGYDSAAKLRSRITDHTHGVDSALRSSVQPSRSVGREFLAFLTT
jgi:hypothetical protein